MENYEQHERCIQHPVYAMPGNIQNAIPIGVIPYSLCTAFSESRE